MKKIIGSISLITLLFSGCTMIPNYKIPQTPEHSFNKNAINEAQKSAANIPWQSFYKDPKLQQLIELALANNRDLRVAMLSIEKSRLTYRIQQASTLPAIDATGSGTRQRVAKDISTTGQPYIASSYSAGVGIGAFELDLFGKLRSMNEQAFQSYLATDAGAKSVRIALIAQVASQYYTIAANKALLEIAEDTRNNLQQAYNISNKQLQIGTENLLTVSQQSTQLEQAKADVVNYGSILQMSKNALDVLVGQSVDESLMPVSMLTNRDSIEYIPAGLSSELLTLRPDIIQAEHELLASNANIGAARAAFFPSISLTAIGGRASNDLSNLFNAGNGMWSFAPNIVLPIFNFGSNYYELKSANVSRDISLARYEKTIQDAFREVLDSISQYDALNDQVKSYESQVSSASKSLFLSQARYKNGIDSYLNVLDSQRTLYTTQKTLINVRLERLNNQATLYKALGGGWKE